MSQRIVYDLLKELGKANIDEILSLAKNKGLKQANNRLKIRDSLILLSRKGVVKEENGKWVFVTGVAEPHFKQTTPHPSQLDISENTAWSPEKKEVKAGDFVDIEIRANTELKYHLFQLNFENRRFFPSYKTDFVLQANIGEMITRVTSARGIAQKGDPDAGARIEGGLKVWFLKHPDLKVGQKLRFTCIKPYEKYRLRVVKN